MIIVLTMPSAKPWWVMTIWNESAILDDRRHFTQICWFHARQFFITEIQEKL
jgi:hypothetical protein